MLYTQKSIGIKNCFLRKELIMTKERRRFIRFPFKINAELTTRGVSYIINEIENLGIGGCLLSIKENFEDGEKCSLKIILGDAGDEPVINVDGLIIRKERGEIAMKFTSIDPESLHHLHEIARYNSNDPDRVDQEIMKHPGIL